VVSFAAALAVFGGAVLLPSRRAKLRFVLLASLSPLLVLYSAEARAYALLSVLVLALFLLAVELEETPVRLAILALLSAAALFTHYLAIFAVGAAVAVAAAERRLRSALAVVTGSLLCLFWVPVMLRQPRAAVAWMHETSGELIIGLLSSFGGAGRIPHPFGPPLPGALVALGAGLTLLLAFALALTWREDEPLRRGIAYLVLFFGGVVFASTARPVAFAGRTEMAVLPIWLWTIARATDRSHLARIATGGVVAVSALGVLQFGPDTPSTTTGSASMTMAFAVVALSAVNLGVVMRREREPAWSSPVFPYLGWIILGWVLTWAAVELNMLERLLDTVSLTGNEWLAVIGLSLLTPALVQVDKSIQLRRRRTTGGPAAAAE